MIEKIRNSDSFTLPGEAGYEDLTLKLAEIWGADAIRDSDGTVLSDKIIKENYKIYSTICPVRMDNEWAKANRDKLQQNYLMSDPVTAFSNTAEIVLLKGYFREQFEVNSKDDPKTWWQVFDRSTGYEIPKENWTFNTQSGTVIIKNTQKYHNYTVNFLAKRIWEGISMYNHITNNWGEKEHLMPVDPIYPETQEAILDFLKDWLSEHPQTDIVRFTSLFYNFAWFWGDPSIQRFRYADWGSYEMTVSPRAMKLFAQENGYEMTSEDFVNNGLYCSSHNVPSKRLWDWMHFMNKFVTDFGRRCINLVHDSGKEAYMFYDDHWVGTEPWGLLFKNLNFDGLIKCVFNAFEARLCSGVKCVKIKELRLHPYLFPTGLKGEPTFMQGGNPALDAKCFWVNIRRGLLREPVDRIGLGGYLHLTEAFPDFIETIENITDQFRELKKLHINDAPYTAPLKAAVLTAWGRWRSWVFTGHFIPGIEIYDVTESLAGLPVDISFISFNDILEHGIPQDVNVIINTGKAGTAWSGGEYWKDLTIIEKITEWVYKGGGFIGIGEPGAVKYNGKYYQLSHLLGIDSITSSTMSNIKPPLKTKPDHFILKDIQKSVNLGKDNNVFLLSSDTEVLLEKEGFPQLTVNSFGRGCAVYFSGFNFDPQNSRLLHRALFTAADKESEYRQWTCSNVHTDCAFYPVNHKLAVINSSKNRETTKIFYDSEKSIKIDLEPYGIKIIEL